MTHHPADTHVDVMLRVNGSARRLRLDSRVTLLGVGLSAAIANAVYHATGCRIRSLPITVEQLL
jgi:hypothetical protein